MALIQNQPISTASAEDNNQRFSADNNNQDFPPSPLQGLLLPPWSWWQRLASRLSHLQLLLEMIWLKSTFWWNYLRKGSSYLRSWDSAAPHCWKVKMSRVQGCTQSLAKLCNRQATKDNTEALTCIKTFCYKAEPVATNLWKLREVLGVLLASHVSIEPIPLVGRVLPCGGHHHMSHRRHQCVCLPVRAVHQAGCACHPW